MSPDRRDLDDLGLRSPERQAEELRAEMDAHIKHRIDDLIAEGVEPDAAARRAREAFGDPRRIEAEVERARRREVQGRRFRVDVVRVLQDLRFALRGLVRRPGFVVVALLTITLGTGATIAIGSVVRSVVLDPLPFEDPDRVSELQMLDPAGTTWVVSEPTFLEWRDGLASFESIAGLATRGGTLQAPGDPASITQGYASAGLFGLLGTPLHRGREFTREEDAPPGGPAGAAPVAIVSEAFWSTRLGSVEDLSGLVVQLDDRVLQVVGVYPRELGIVLGDAPVITPLAASPAMDRGEHYMTVLGRRAAGVSPERAREEIATAVERAGEIHEVHFGWSATTESIDRVLIGEQTIRAGWVLLAAAGLLLAMACLNVSSLLLARGTTRQRELETRRAIGAGRAGIVRLLLTEAGSLVALGSALGVGLAYAVLPTVRALASGRISRIDEAVVDPGLALVVIGTTAVATFLFGTLPVVRVGRGSTALRSRGVAGGSRLRRGFVVAQLATSLALLTGTGLLFRSFMGLAAVDPGFETEGRVALRLSMPDGLWTWEERGPLLQDIMAAVRDLPGVVSAGATAVDPFSGYSLANRVAREDQMPERPIDFTPIYWRTVTPDFFSTMELEILEGRDFRNADAELDRQPILIDERLAVELFGSPAAAVGGTMVWGDPDGSRMEVLGVVEEFRDVELGETPERMVYRLHARLPWAAMTVVARVRGELSQTADPIRAAVRGAAPGLPVPELIELEATLDRALAEPRFNVLLLAGFAGAGLLLAIVGLYGLTAFEVRQRFREIGIRMSLGARPESVVALIVRERLTLSAWGIGLGLIGAALVSASLESLLFGVSRADPITWIGAALLMLATCWVAAWIPARRAARVDPREVLSAE